MAAILENVVESHAGHKDVDSESEPDPETSGDEDLEEEVEGGVVAGIEEEEEEVDALAGLADLRAGLDGVGRAPEKHFKHDLRGGTWTLEHTGRVANEVRGETVGGRGRAWCGLYAFPPSKTLSIARYGLESCMYLIREYCKRGEFFIGIWIAGGCSELFTYSAALVASIPEDAEFEEYILGLEPEHPAVAKAVDISLCSPVVVA